MNSVIDQPPPKARPDLTPIWDQVIDDVVARYPSSSSEDLGVNVGRVLADMRERDQVGRKRYGVSLTIHNGRDQLMDLYQELLDAAAYAKAALMEGESIALNTIYLGTIDHIVLVRALIHDKVARRNA